MGEKMTPMSFDKLVNWVLTEHKNSGTVFGEKKPYIADPKNNRTIFGRTLETPIGPAAGPHTQLTQNIVAAYYTGSRFFELKTVQVMDGAELSACVPRPCIKADDECYNAEWSTELYVPQAMEEYIKAWFLCKVIAIEYGLGDPNGFQFNISVGYDLEGIKSEKVDNFLNTMQNAANSEVFKNCKQYLLDNLDKFEKLTAEDVEAIQAEICNSVTISTLHGCPPHEIERIAMHLITEKGYNTFIKCNPTLLGYEYARKLMDDMGYDYVAFGDFHFLDDLQYEDAVPMLQRLQKVCDEKGLAFGVKITNTFPVDVKAGELPSKEMYMSGKSLYPLSMSVANKLAHDFDGKLRISYSGGADFFNIDKIVGAGIWPVTIATTLLKPGGYDRTGQIVNKIADKNLVFDGVDKDATAQIVEDLKTDKHHVKPVKPLPSRKMNKEVPLVDCFTAPCKEGCPIHQDITTYLDLVNAGKYEEAMDVITEKNPLPWITGTICAHNCMNKCTRNFYEESVHIRDMKLVATQNGYDALMAKLEAPAVTKEGKVAIVGGGPAGMAAAYFLRKAGKDVTIFEQHGALGGTVRHIIPEFRIASSSLDKDAAILEKLGVNIKVNTKIESVEALKAEGFDTVVLATGASAPGTLKLEAGETKNAVEFLAEFKAADGKLNIGKNVVVIGGGNTAMDTARAAKRTTGVEKVSLVYRRTKKYMPADAEELELAIEDGVEFAELLAPVKLEGGKLLCKVMQLGEPDASGRRGVVETEETVEVDADTVLVAVGEKVPTAFYQANGLNVNERGKALVNEETLESNVAGVYVVGDGLGGPATVVEGIADGLKAAEAIIGEKLVKDYDNALTSEAIYGRKANLVDKLDGKAEAARCLGCSTICENCVEACPNRANVAIKVPGMEKAQVIHVDYMCNECGNCKSFCPYSSAPYLDKFTLFGCEEDMADSKNQGFLVLDKDAVVAKVRVLGEEFTWTKGEETKLAEGLQKIIETVCKDYAYML